MNKAYEAHYLIEDLRQYLLPVMIQVFGDKCSICGDQCNSYDIDHKRYGDDITIYDLQLLCTDCHRNKTMNSNDAHLTNTPHCSSCTCY